MYFDIKAININNVKKKTLKEYLMLNTKFKFRLNSFKQYFFSSPELFILLIECN